MQSRKRKVLHYVVDGRDVFEEWFDALPDPVGRSAIYDRIARLEDGNPGDHCAFGGGLWELRVHYGPGYRVYYGEAGPVIVLLLCGGDKKTQSRDIRRAHRMWENWRRIK